MSPQAPGGLNDPSALRAPGELPYECQTCLLRDRATGSVVGAGYVITKLVGRLGIDYEINPTAFEGPK